MDFDSLILRYSQKGVLVDTNILLLYFVGKVNRERVARFKRTEQFLPEDFDILLRLLKGKRECYSSITCYDIWQSSLDTINFININNLSGFPLIIFH
jgi:hypothetical protein